MKTYLNLFRMYLKCLEKENQNILVLTFDNIGNFKVKENEIQYLNGSRIMFDSKI